MKPFAIETDSQVICFNFPTSLAEISEKYLEDVTSNIHVADNYALVGLVYHDSLGPIIIARKQSKKGLTSGVVPIFIKAGSTDNEFIKSATIKNKLIIASSQLNLAHHVAAPKNTISLDYFIKCIDRDTTIAQRYSNNYGKEECYFVEFKMVPICDIVGFYDDSNTIIDNPFTSISLKGGDKDGGN